MIDELDEYQKTESKNEPMGKSDQLNTDETDHSQQEIAKVKIADRIRTHVSVLFEQFLSKQVDEKMRKKYHQILNTLKSLNEYDWTNYSDVANSQYPKKQVSSMTAIVFQFIINSQYFHNQDFSRVFDEARKKIEAKELEILLESGDHFIDSDNIVLKNKKQYDYCNDLFIQEIKQLIMDRKTTDLVEIENIYRQFICTNKIFNRQEADLQRDYSSKMFAKMKINQPSNKLVIAENSDGLLQHVFQITQDELSYLENVNSKVSQEESTGQKKENQYVLKTLHYLFSVNQFNVEDALCQICNDGDYTDDNLIVFCAKCNISVHQRCYLLPFIPSGDWICDLCSVFGARGQFLRCPLCPKLGGAMKQTKILHSQQVFQQLNPEYHQAQNCMSNDNLEKLCILIIFQHFQFKKVKLNSIFIKIFQIYRSKVILNKFIHIQTYQMKNIKNLMHPKFGFIYHVFTGFLNVLLTKSNNQLVSRIFKRNASICNVLFAIQKVFQKIYYNIIGVGGCVQCSKGSCQVGYHPECARRAQKFMQVSITSDNRLEYYLFCDKHAPLKVKRVLEQKYRTYESEILNFFKQFDRFKEKIIRAHKQKLMQKKMKHHEKQSICRGKVYKDQEIQDFAIEFAKFLQNRENEQITLTFKRDHTFESAYFPELSSQACYELRTVPRILQHKVSQFQKAIIPFFNSNIRKEDPIWYIFRYNSMSIEQLYNLYSSCVRKASKILSELNPLKNKQLQLLEILTNKKKQDVKIEQKKEIIYQKLGDEVIVKDENLYCVCRKQFLEGQQMICCEGCDEWFHFECIGFKGSMAQAEQIQFYCFMCSDQMLMNGKISKLTKNYKKYFMDPFFLVQKEIANEINLYDLREERIKNKQLEKEREQSENIDQQVGNKTKFKDENSESKIQVESQEECESNENKREKQNLIKEEILINLPTQIEVTSEKKQIIEPENLKVVSSPLDQEIQKEKEDKIQLVQDNQQNLTISIDIEIQNDQQIMIEEVDNQELIKKKREQYIVIKETIQSLDDQQKQETQIQNKEDGYFNEQVSVEESKFNDQKQIYIKENDKNSEKIRSLKPFQINEIEKQSDLKNKNKAMKQLQIETYLRKNK